MLRVMMVVLWRGLMSCRGPNCNTSGSVRIIGRDNRAIGRRSGGCGMAADDRWRR